MKHKCNIGIYTKIEKNIERISINFSVALFILQPC